MGALAEPLCLDGYESSLAETIVGIHDRIVCEKGFNPGFSEQQYLEAVGLVESVVAPIFCTFFGQRPCERYPDVFAQVSAFATHLSKDHIFPDANKRTTVVAVLALLRQSGLTLGVPDSADPSENLLYGWIQEVVSSEKSLEELTEVLRENAVALRRP